MIMNSENPADFATYLEDYGGSAYAPLARQRFAALSASAEPEVARLAPAATAAPPVLEASRPSVEAPPAAIATAPASGAPDAPRVTGSAASAADPAPSREPGGEFPGLHRVSRHGGSAGGGRSGWARSTVRPTNSPSARSG